MQFTVFQVIAVESFSLIFLCPITLDMVDCCSAGFYGMQPGGNHTDLKFEFPELNGRELLRELILYIAYKCADDPTFGAVKLNKILFYSDFFSYFRFGEPISGIEYMRLPNGPAPKHLVPVRESMKERGEISEEKIGLFTKTRHRICPLREPDLGEFSGRDIALIDEVIETLWAKTATEVSELSHQRAWRIAKDRESIPYQAIFLSDDGLTESDIARANELSEEHGWARCES